jgi:hypothetical protein
VKCEFLLEVQAESETIVAELKMDEDLEAEPSL